MQNIETTSDKYTILLVSEPSMTITALISCLEKEIKSAVSLVEKQEISEKLSTSSGLVLIDLSAFEGDTVSFVKQSLAPFSEQHVFALFNAHDLSAKELASWPFIKGVFKKEDDLEHLCHGIEKMLSGEYWLPRQKLAELIHYYQQNNNNAIDYSEICLTNREQQILRKLVTGASNSEIADSLFVSEHTVKSHLYNIFKKINVKNRVQAVFWAKNNLSVIGLDYQG
ncbi:LuxR C-terminal-related transcriptional regulator [Grimontia kaedaensis]|uniref:CsgBAC operon transcriptional regulatory protein n=2 Tax=Grimontia TaxID=246861 RepID=A0A128FAW4_9GAMM|nr:MULTISPECIES: LuxR C-terminal-related transcriptional regulator [Grimontia]USH02755.1 LuxR C-terminal-related transcriptional regulator [Grimontia kaedaensis]CZF83431.1 CsgBAC operon transcriptional regulatory protein [Grimontia celer]